MLSRSLLRHIVARGRFFSNTPAIAASGIDGFTPEEIVSELDKFIVGQTDAKKSVALALRNRMRRAKLETRLQSEVSPMNIMLIGSTGTGKTEISRRMAKLVDAPFVVAQATSFTEVGVVGPNTDSIIQDLVDAAIQLETTKQRKEVQSWARGEVEDILVDLLAGADASKELKQSIRTDLRANKLEDKEVSIDMRALNIERDRAAALAKAAARKQRKDSDQQQARPSPGGARFRPPMGGFGMPMMGFPGAGGGAGAPDLDKMMGTLSGIFEQMQQHYSDSSKKEGDSNANQNQKRERKQTYTVRDVRPLLEEMEEMRKIDFDSVRDAALRRAENHGIVFLDEIDKLANSTEYQSGKGRGIKGEGVQKELLAITDGATVQTSHGPISTNHILFIGAGAFHVAKPSDLLPELQGRFPVRVELKALTQADLRRILTEPDFNLLQQQSALLATEGVRVDFTADGIDEIAQVAHEVNSTQQNIGARRLRTIVARVMEDISFRAPTIKRDAPPERVDATYVRQRVGSLSSKTDLSRFIL